MYRGVRSAATYKGYSQLLAPSWWTLTVDLEDRLAGWPASSFISLGEVSTSSFVGMWGKGR